MLAFFEVTFVLDIHNLSHCDTGDPRDCGGSDPKIY